MQRSSSTATLLLFYPLVLSPATLKELDLVQPAGGRGAVHARGASEVRCEDGFNHVYAAVTGPRCIAEKAMSEGGGCTCNFLSPFMSSGN